MENLRVGYKCATIDYDEKGNHFDVDINGLRLRSNCVSLTEAKKVVDEFLKKSRTFKELKAYLWENIWGSLGSEENFIEVKVTSVTEDNGECWIVKSDGKREKKMVKNVFEISPHNTKLVTEINRLQTEIEIAEKSIDEKKKLLTKISFEKK